MPDSTSVLIMRDDFKILACSRKDDPDAFGLPGGKVDLSDNSLAIAAHRELHEETGVSISAKNLSFIHSGLCKGSTTYMNHTFIALKSLIYSWDLEKLSPHQVPGEGRVAWIPPLLLLYGPFADYNRILLEKIGYLIDGNRVGPFAQPYPIMKTIDGHDFFIKSMPSQESLLKQIEACPDEHT